MNDENSYILILDNIVELRSNMYSNPGERFGFSVIPEFRFLPKNQIRNFVSNALSVTEVTERIFCLIGYASMIGVHIFKQKQTQECKKVVYFDIFHTKHAGLNSSSESDLVYDEFCEHLSHFCIHGTYFHLTKKYGFYQPVAISYDEHIQLKLSNELVFTANEKTIII